MDTRARRTRRLLLGLLFGVAAGVTLACSEGSVRDAEVREAQEDVGWEAAGSSDPAAATGSPRDEPRNLEDVAEAYASDLARRPADTDWTGGDAGAGQALYVSHCALCHGAGGAGDGPAAVALNPKPRDFRTGTFYLDGNANGETGEAIDLARVIREGPAAFGGSDAMVAWKDQLSEDEIRDLVAYIGTLGG